MNTTFSHTTPGLQLAWDSVSRGAALTCPRYYQLTVAGGPEVGTPWGTGWAPRTPNFHLTFGILAHSTRERYYHARARGKSHDDALDEALEWLLEATWDRPLNRPWISGDTAKNRFTLVRSMVWYFDKWQDDPLETIILADGKPAVELSFRFATDYITHDGEVFELCGHLDRLARFGDHTHPSDLKTTKNDLNPFYFASFTPDDQISGYSFALPIVWGLPAHGPILDAMQVLVGGTRFQRQPISRTPTQLDEWYQDLRVRFAEWETYARVGVWPMNPKACWRCDFRPICSRPPATRVQWLKADFVQRTWDPLIARGDV